MNTYLIAALIATVMLLSLYIFSLKRYPVSLVFDLPNQVAEYKVPSDIADQPFSVSLELCTKSSLGGICIFSIGGYTIDLRVQNAKVVLLFKVTSSKAIKLTLSSKENLYEGRNSLYVETVISSATLKVTLTLNGNVTSGIVKNLKGLSVAPTTVTFGHLNFKGCLANLYFNNEMVDESNLILINVIKGCVC